MHVGQGQLSVDRGMEIVDRRVGVRLRRTNNGIASVNFPLSTVLHEHIKHQHPHLDSCPLHPIEHTTSRKIDNNMTNQKRVALIGLSSKGKGYVTTTQLPNAT
jgi:hypothetical protein